MPCLVNRTLTWNRAYEVVGAAAAKAEELAIKVNISVFDSAGNSLAFLRMPGAFLQTDQIAMDKARTAACFGFPTAEWPALLAEMSETVKCGLSVRREIVMFGGGIPILWRNCVIGGIGVSGGTEAQDVECAAAGRAVVGGTESSDEQSALTR